MPPKSLTSPMPVCRIFSPVAFSSLSLLTAVRKIKIYRVKAKLGLRCVCSIHYITKLFPPANKFNTTPFIYGISFIDSNSAIEFMALIFCYYLKEKKTKQDELPSVYYTSPKFANYGKRRIKTKHTQETIRNFIILNGVWIYQNSKMLCAYNDCWGHTGFY